LETALSSQKLFVDEDLKLAVPVRKLSTKEKKTKDEILCLTGTNMERQIRNKCTNN
jgi:hypothetical protein